jgi:cobalt-zinc-cadmium efflux system outer membrane protein
MGSVMLPVLRYQAIDAGIRQAEDNLRSAEALRRQTSHDLASRIVGDLSMVRDLDRQIELYRTTLLPRAKQVIDAGQNTYAGGQSSFLDLLDSQRSLIALRRMVADFQATRIKELADLEAAMAAPLPTQAPAGMMPEGH